MRHCMCVPRRAVGLGKSGAVYIGVNLEFPGLPLNNSVSHLCVLPLPPCDMSDHGHCSAARTIVRSGLCKPNQVCITQRSSLCCDKHS